MIAKFAAALLLSIAASIDVTVTGVGAVQLRAKIAGTKKNNMGRLAWVAGLLGSGSAAMAYPHLNVMRAPAPPSIPFVSQPGPRAARSSLFNSASAQERLAPKPVGPLRSI